MKKIVCKEYIKTEIKKKNKNRKNRIKVYFFTYNITFLLIGI